MNDALNNNVNFIGLFDLKNLEEIETQVFTYENRGFSLKVQSPNCDCRDYRITSGLFVYEIITKNGQKTINIFMRRVSDMDFSGLDMSYMPVDGFCIVKNNQLKHEGFWVTAIEKEINLINEWTKNRVEEKNRLKELNLQNILNVYNNYFENMA